MKTEAVIRTAKETDIQKILEISRDTWAETYENKELGITKKELLEFNKITDERIDKVRKRVLEAKHPSYIAEVNGDVVGYALPFRDANGLARLGALYVLSKYHSRGIGSLLITKVLDYWDEDVYLYVVEYNTKAIKFYQMHGFDFTNDTLEYFELPSGKRLPERKMVLKKSSDVRYELK